MKNQPSEALIIFRVAELFFAGKRIREIADQLNAEFKLPSPLSREAIYPLLAKSRDRQFVRLVPPLEENLARRIAERFRNVNVADIRIVQTATKESNDQVAAVAADWAYELMCQRVDDLCPFTIGFGPGRASLDFSNRLAEIIRFAEQPPQLRLIGITAGCPANLPQFASSSFFNLFPRQAVSEFLGLFTSPLVRNAEFPEFRQRPPLADVFEERESVDLVVTGMGDFLDKDDLLGVFLRQMGVNIDALIEKGYLGNVQYRPFTRDGFVQEGPDEYRAVTLFELSDFYQMARTKNKEVVLIARQCGRCGMTRARTVRPLLENERMKVWSKLVMDVATARELLKARD